MGSYHKSTNACLENQTNHKRMDKAAMKSISNNGSMLFQEDAYDLNDGMFNRLPDMQRCGSFESNYKIFLQLSINNKI